MGSPVPVSRFSSMIAMLSRNLSAQIRPQGGHLGGLRAFVSVLSHGWRQFVIQMAQACACKFPGMPFFRTGHKRPGALRRGIHETKLFPPLGRSSR